MNVIVAYWGEWRLECCYYGSDDIAEEAVEFAESHGYAPPWDAVARCRRRMELWSHAPDPNMDHVNDYIIAQQVIEEAFPGAILYAPHADELL